MSLRYYERFIEALEAILVRREIRSDAELAERVRALEARPHGHDH